MHDIASVVAIHTYVRLVLGASAIHANSNAITCQAQAVNLRQQEVRLCRELPMLHHGVVEEVATWKES